MAHAHGRSSTYSAGCRCQLCLVAHRAVGAKSRKAAEARLRANPSLARHGRYSTYSYWGCRCQLCGDAMRRQRGRM